VCFRDTAATPKSETRRATDSRVVVERAGATDVESPGEAPAGGPSCGQSGLTPAEQRFARWLVQEALRSWRPAR